MHGPRNGGGGVLVGELEAPVNVLRVDPLDEGAVLPAQSPPRDVESVSQPKIDIAMLRFIGWLCEFHLSC